MSLEEQPRPQASHCPKCGGDPLDESVSHNLSHLGYQHDDIKNVCEDCGHQWTQGVPIGEFDRPEMADDLWCGSCDDEWMLVHRVTVVPKNVELHLKCPNCKNFERAQRTPDSGRVALVGYPQITGSTEDCDAYGYPNRDTRVRDNEA